MFAKVISRWHLYIKSVFRRPYQLAPQAVQNHFHGLTTSRQFDTVVTSQELFKIVGKLSSISLLENGTNLTMGHLESSKHGLLSQ